ncbi:hypothetical protein FisN_6Lh050 [Fistulifera solaris]|uniref:Uncharacterized protein n=1 Tax=Fistulifera solaris TaxID=1519565 RepID=A0A1Z5KP90_FISSO|nr:hypothetical protein FisN_6Lh050 [Fistulifera solaris]|eukprot:GAX28133.1 hypothetical protein FisN_6Lh050 [Fistulifera solaris]
MKRLWRNQERKRRDRSGCMTLALIACGGFLVFWMFLFIVLMRVVHDNAAHLEHSRIALSERLQLRAKQKKKKQKVVGVVVKNASKILKTTPLGYAARTDQKPSFLFGLPTDVATEHQYRYQSNGIFWEVNHDPLYESYYEIVIESAETQVKDFQLLSDVQLYHQNFTKQMKQIGIRVGNVFVPDPVRQYQKRVSKRLRQAGLGTLADIFDNTYAFALEQTTFPLSDGTTFVTTGDTALMGLRDSSAQVHPYMPLLSQSHYLLRLVEGLLRRQSLFLQADPYAASFRLFLDHDFTGRRKLTDSDYAYGQTIHVAKHNFELDNLAYHLRLSYKLFQFYQQNNRPMLALDSNWIRGVDLILQTIMREQNHAESPYRHPELKGDEKGQPVCQGDGLVWTGFRPSGDPTELGYLIPVNQMMVVSLRQTTEIFRSMKDDIRAQQCEELADSIDKGIHTHGVIEHEVYGKLYAYEVDACGGSKIMDEAIVPSLLSLDYMEYFSPQQDSDQLIQKNTRKFILSKNNPNFHSSEGPDGCINEWIGSPHTAESSISHWAVIMRAMTAESDAELRQALSTLARTAANDLMDESVLSNDPASLSKISLVLSNSLFAELIASKLEDIIKVYRNETLNSC